MSSTMTATTTATESELKLSTSHLRCLPSIPKTMQAIQYQSIANWSLVTKSVPVPKPHEVLVKVQSCGICGTDLHIHTGEFSSLMPVVTGHETSGLVVALGSDVTSLQLGQKVTADNAELCGHCHYCVRGELLYCEGFRAHGVHLDGGLAEYCVFPASALFAFERLSWTSASLFEAASCAIHGLDRLAPHPGSSVLMIGAGATGLLLAQLLRQNGGSRLVLAANAGPKMELAKKLDCADEYLELDRQAPEAQWDELKKKEKYGFDVVVEASGSVDVLEKAIGYVARGGKLMYYGVYPKKALVNVSPSKVFGDELTIIGSFSQSWCLPRSVQYLESGKVNVEGIVTHTFPLKDFGKALDAVKNKTCIKATVVMDE